jgi:leader peptidase (prepilin peptidase)/N-methyltransferase
MSTVIISIFIFIYGLLIGSFLNVCIYRIPLKKTVVRGRSFCPNCQSLIPWYLNIPLFSFLFLKGRCKSCQMPISPIYPAVELLNGVLWLLAYFAYGFTIQGLAIAILFSVLIIIALIDFKYQIIPDGLVTIIVVIGLFCDVLVTVLYGQPWYIAFFGLFAASVPLYLLGLIYEDGIGGGDIKLMAAAGLIAGWKLILLALFLGAIYAGILALFMVVRKKATLKTALPFGPFLAAGIVTALLIGDRMLSAYMAFYQSFM